MNEFIELLGLLSINFCHLFILGMAFYVTFRAGFVNLGISGQLVVATTIGVLGLYFAEPLVQYFATLRVPLSLSIFTLISFLICWGAGIFAVCLCLRFKVHSVLATLFLTYVFVALNSSLLKIEGVGRDGETPIIPLESKPSNIFLFQSDDLYLDLNYVAVFGVFFAVFLLFIIQKMPLWYEAKALAENPQMVSSRRTFKILFQLTTISSVLLTLFIISDSFIIAGYYGNSTYDFIGFTGVVVALCARRNILGFFIETVRRKKMKESAERYETNSTIKEILNLATSAALISVIEVLMLRASTSEGLNFPVETKYLVYGLFLIFIAYGLPKRAGLN